MRRLFVLVLLIGGFSVSTLRAQVADASVCDILANPQSFDGKIVRVRGTVSAGFEDFVIKDTKCNQPINAIWLAYPEGAQAKAGPVAMVRLQLAKNHPAAVTDIKRLAVTLDRNNDFEDFDTLLSMPAKLNGVVCLGCAKFIITATLIGRLDGAKDAGFMHNGSGKVIGIAGFGNLNQYAARLVLQSVSDISPEEIDYARGAAAGSSSGSNGFFTPGNPTPDQIRRGTDAFGAPGEDNGVDVKFGVANEVPKDDTAKSTTNSPDGLKFLVTFDSDRLKEPLMQIALSHLGTHIADLRSTTPGVATETFYGAEFRAWQTSVLDSIALKLKTLTLPGGHVVYSQSWSNDDLGKNANAAIAEFLGNWAAISNPSKP